MADLTLISHSFYTYVLQNEKSFTFQLKLVVFFVDYSCNSGINYFQNTRFSVV